MERTKRHIKSAAVKALENFALEALKKQYPNFPYPPAPKYSDKTANGLTTCIVDYIALRGFLAERINTTGQQINTASGKKWIKGSSKKGSADIHSCIQGRYVAIEIKCEATGDKYQSDDQKAYQKETEAAGGIYLIIRTFEEFYNWFNRKTI